MYGNIENRDNGFDMSDTILSSMFGVADRHRLIAEEMEARALKIAELMRTFPEQEDSVIFFRMQFTNGVSYTYAAVSFKTASDGPLRWATTGPKAPKYYSTGEMINWMCQNTLEELWMATSWEEV